MNETILSAIDIGTNSVHLVVVKANANGNFVILTSEKESVRLGSGAGDLDLITEEAMQRCLHALERFLKIAQSWNAPVRAVATSAVREAKNGQDFVDLIKQKINLNIEVISGREEALHIYRGVLQGLPLYDKKILTIDIGGGSTEFVIGQYGDPILATSLKLGAIRLKERFFSKEPLSPGDIDECRKYIRIVMEGLRQEVLSIGYEQAVGSSGTIETIASMIQPDSEERDISFSIDELHKAVESLLSSDTSKKRARLPGLDEKRADIIVPGAILLEEIFYLLKIKNIKLSSYALREGIICDTLLNQYAIGQNPDNIRKNSVIHMSERLMKAVSPTFAQSAKHIAKLTLILAQRLENANLIENLSPEDKLILESAAMLHNTGMIISHSAHHKHSYYLIKNSEHLLGFSSLQIETIALVARYHRKAIPSKKHPEFAALSPDLQRRVMVLSGILRLCTGLDRENKENVIDIKIEKNNGSVTMKLIASRTSDKQTNDISLELWAGKLKSDLLEKILNKEITFTYE